MHPTLVSPILSACILRLCISRDDWPATGTCNNFEIAVVNSLLWCGFFLAQGRHYWTRLIKVSCFKMTKKFLQSHLANMLMTHQTREVDDEKEHLFGQRSNLLLCCNTKHAALLFFPYIKQRDKKSTGSWFYLAMWATTWAT